MRNAVRDMTGLQCEFFVNFFEKYAEMLDNPANKEYNKMKLVF